MSTLKEILTAAEITVTEEQYSFLTEYLVPRSEIPVAPVSKAGGKRYWFKSSKFLPKTPLQMRQLVLIMHEEKSLTMAEWSKIAGEILVTRQDPSKIIAFYRKRMLDEGLISEHGPVGEVSEPVVESPKTEIAEPTANEILSSDWRLPEPVVEEVGEDHLLDAPEVTAEDETEVIGEMVGEMVEV